METCYFDFTDEIIPWLQDLAELLDSRFIACEDVSTEISSSVRKA